MEDVIGVILLLFILTIIIFYFVAPNGITPSNSSKNEIQSLNYDSIYENTTNQTDLKPIDPTPIDPTPIEPTPIEPTPIDPTPIDPTPIDPEPIDPEPIDPKELRLKDLKDFLYPKLSTSETLDSIINNTDYPTDLTVQDLKDLNLIRSNSLLEKYINNNIINYSDNVSDIKNLFDPDIPFVNVITFDYKSIKDIIHTPYINYNMSILFIEFYLDKKIKVSDIINSNVIEEDSYFNYLYNSDIIKDDDLITDLLDNIILEDMTPRKMFIDPYVVNNNNSQHINKYPDKTIKELIETGHFSPDMVLNDLFYYGGFEVHSKLDKIMSKEILHSRYTLQKALDENLLSDTDTINTLKVVSLMTIREIMNSEYKDLTVINLMYDHILSENTTIQDIIDSGELHPNTPIQKLIDEGIDPKTALNDAIMNDVIYRMPFIDLIKNPSKLIFEIVKNPEYSDMSLSELLENKLISLDVTVKNLFDTGLIEPDSVLQYNVDEGYFHMTDKINHLIYNGELPPHTTIHELKVNMRQAIIDYIKSPKGDLDFMSVLDERRILMTKSLTLQNLLDTDLVNNESILGKLYANKTIYPTDRIFNLMENGIIENQSLNSLIIENSDQLTLKEKILKNQESMIKDLIEDGTISDTIKYDDLLHTDLFDLNSNLIYYGNKRLMHYNTTLKTMFELELIPIDINFKTLMETKIYDLNKIISSPLKNVPLIKLIDLGELPRNLKVKDLKDYVDSDSLYNTLLNDNTINLEEHIYDIIIDNIISIETTLSQFIHTEKPTQIVNNWNDIKSSSNNILKNIIDDEILDKNTTIQEILDNNDVHENSHLQKGLNSGEILSEDTIMVLLILDIISPNDTLKDIIIDQKLLDHFKNLLDIYNDETASDSLGDLLKNIIPRTMTIKDLLDLDIVHPESELQKLIDSNKLDENSTILYSVLNGIIDVDKSLRMLVNEPFKPDLGGIDSSKEIVELINTNVLPKDLTVQDIIDSGIIEPGSLLDDIINTEGFDPNITLTDLLTSKNINDTQNLDDIIKTLPDLTKSIMTGEIRLDDNIVDIIGNGMELTTTIQDLLDTELISDSSLLREKLEDGTITVNDNISTLLEKGIITPTTTLNDFIGPRYPPIDVETLINDDKLNVDSNIKDLINEGIINDDTTLKELCESSLFKNNNENGNENGTGTENGIINKYVTINCTDSEYIPSTKDNQLFDTLTNLNQDRTINDIIESGDLDPNITIVDIYNSNYLTEHTILYKILENFVLHYKTTIKYVGNLLAFKNAHLYILITSEIFKPDDESTTYGPLFEANLTNKYVHTKYADMNTYLYLYPEINKMKVQELPHLVLAWLFTVSKSSITVDHTQNETCHGVTKDNKTRNILLSVYNIPNYTFIEMYEFGIIKDDDILENLVNCKVFLNRIELLKQHAVIITERPFEHVANVYHEKDSLLYEYINKGTLPLDTPFYKISVRKHVYNPYSIIPGFFTIQDMLNMGIIRADTSIFHITTYLGLAFNTTFSYYNISCLYPETIRINRYWRDYLKKRLHNMSNTSLFHITIPSPNYGQTFPVPKYAKDIINNHFGDELLNHSYEDGDLVLKGIIPNEFWENLANLSKAYYYYPNSPIKDGVKHTSEIAINNNNSLVDHVFYKIIIFMYSPTSTPKTSVKNSSDIGIGYLSPIKYNDGSETLQTIGFIFTGVIPNGINYGNRSVLKITGTQWLPITAIALGYSS